MFCPWEEGRSNWTAIVLWSTLSVPRIHHEEDFRVDVYSKFVFRERAKAREHALMLMLFHVFPRKAFLSGKYFYFY